MQIIHHKEKCIGCKACQQACQDLHNFPPKMKVMEIIEKESGKADALTVEYRMSVCRQCLRPVCMAECMEEAISRNEDGIVLVDEALCIGCGRCAACGGIISVTACCIATAVTICILTGLAAAIISTIACARCTGWCT